MSLAPIVLFVYNRPWHTQKTVESLQKNELSEQSDLIVYSDAAKNDEAIKSVEEVRSYIKSVDGFKKITIIEREKNWGLADSIIDGVTNIVNKYGKIIVLEDDIVTSPVFLQFMNQSLDFYEQEKKVWHISGWNYPIETEYLSDVFMWRIMNCWGWATWANRWQYFEKKPEGLIENWTTKEKHQFDLDGSGLFWNQVLANHTGKINTWAIFWYATIFQRNGLCLNPAVSFVDNIGHDGTGVHCGNDTKYKPMRLPTTFQVNLSAELKESSHAVKLIQGYLKKKKRKIYIRAINKIYRSVFGRDFIR
jgi:hypothetical protein